ncbi:MAG TPA: T9SS type B sorting domain-containing protein [Flavobacterium sp.]
MNNQVNLSVPFTPLFSLKDWVRCSILFLISLTSYAQLPTFTLTITKTEETCLGNGTLTFNVSGTDPAASIEYYIYQHPDLVNPISFQTSNFLGGRTAGTYRVVAKQTLGGESNSVFQDITIFNQTVPVFFEVSGSNALCGSDGTISVEVLNGNAVLYELFTGPVTRPPQPSPVFSGVPAGVYDVRVFNNCGDATVITFTLESGAADIDISTVGFTPELPSCDTIEVTNTLSATGAVLAYPLEIEYTIHPPGGAPSITLFNTIPSGSPTSVDVAMVIPFYYDQLYTFDMTIIDQCGNEYISPGHEVDQHMVVSLTAQNAECGELYLTSRAMIYVPPFNMNFTVFPEGFDPFEFNETYPGPFTAAEAAFGSETMPVPFGLYSLTITDSCGRTANDNTELINEPTEAESLVIPYPGCQSDTSRVEITIPGFTIVSAIITDASPLYTFPIPDDVSDQVTEEDGLVLQFLPTGDYVVELIDECGNSYIEEFFVPGLQTTVTYSSRGDCEIGKGAIRIRGNSTEILSIIMTQAPAGVVTPVDVSYNLTSAGVFSMNNLQPGIYEFEILDNCGQTNLLSDVEVISYDVSASEVTLTPHCGSFDITLDHDASGMADVSYWLQMLDPNTGNWVHPDTQVVYVPGSPPDATNSIQLQNNDTLLNLIFTGDFRVVVQFETFENGSVGQFKDCYEVLEEFEFTGQFAITGFEKLSCAGTTADVRVLTNGVPPLTFKIILKNSQPFFVDNGNNNIFTGLDQAVYTFEVQHACGDIATGESDVAQLPSLAVANQPADIVACDDISNDGTEIIDLTQQNAAILGMQAAANFTITYHLSQTDANSGLNTLPLQYNTGSTTIYARLKHIQSVDCIDFTSFNVVVNPVPDPNLEPEYGICENGTLPIIAESGFSSYLWSTGATGQQVVITTPGTYTLTVTKNYGTKICSATHTFEVVAVAPPEAFEVSTSDWTNNENTITIAPTADDAFEYSLDGITYQPEGFFGGLSPGEYTVYIRDVLGCEPALVEVYLLNYPRFFTPNGDGFNEYWKVQFSEHEPAMMTYIYDRYGKLITGFLPDSPGWDGKLNGRSLPSTDYWFVVERQNGKVFRGHFSMKR